MAIPNYRTCRTPRDVHCDGIDHAWAVWDDEMNRHVPVDAACPNRQHNRRVAYWERYGEDPWGES